MVIRVTAAEAKVRLSELLSKAGFGNERVIIERHGKPVAALVSMEDVERLEDAPASTGEREPPKGALALLGIWADVPDEEIDEMLRVIYEARALPGDRPIVDFDE